MELGFSCFCQVRVLQLSDVNPNQGGLVQLATHSSIALSLSQYTESTDLWLNFHSSLSVDTSKTNFLLECICCSAASLHTTEFDRLGLRRCIFVVLSVGSEL